MRPAWFSRCLRTSFSMAVSAVPTLMASKSKLSRKLPRLLAKELECLVPSGRVKFPLRVSRLSYWEKNKNKTKIEVSCFALFFSKIFFFYPEPSPQLGVHWVIFREAQVSHHGVHMLLEAITRVEFRNQSQESLRHLVSKKMLFVFFVFVLVLVFEVK